MKPSNPWAHRWGFTHSISLSYELHCQQQIWALCLSHPPQVSSLWLLSYGHSPWFWQAPHLQLCRTVLTFVLRFSSAIHQFHSLSFLLGVKATVLGTAQYFAISRIPCQLKVKNSDTTTFPLLLSFGVAKNTQQHQGKSLMLNIQVDTVKKKAAISLLNTDCCFPKHFSICARAIQLWHYGHFWQDHLCHGGYVTHDSWSHNIPARPMTD